MSGLRFVVELILLGCRFGFICWCSCCLNWWVWLWWYFVVFYVDFLCVGFRLFCFLLLLLITVVCLCCLIGLELVKGVCDCCFFVVVLFDCLLNCLCLVLVFGCFGLLRFDVLIVCIAGLMSGLLGVCLLRWVFDLFWVCFTLVWLRLFEWLIGVCVCFIALCGWLFALLVFGCLLLRCLF